MKDYLYRKITMEQEEYSYKVIRACDSDGEASINVYMENKRIISFSGDYYEDRAHELAALIEAIALQPCSLPEKSNGG